MKICIYGAGAVGGHIAARLAIHGDAEVSVVARGEHLAAIQRHGLRVETRDGVLTSHPVATDDPQSLGPQDLVIVAVKAPALPSIADGVSGLLGPDSLALFAMNGIPWWYFHGQDGALANTRLPRIDPTGALWDKVRPERAVGAVAYTACSVVAPGVIKAENPRNRLLAGRPDGRPDPRLERLATLLDGSGLEFESTARIRDAIWAKLLMNLVGGSLGILTASAMKHVLDKSTVARAADAMAKEAATIARALGCEPGNEGIGKLASSGHKQSILQDLEAGRPMEIDAMLRVPLELARLVDVPTPTLDLVIELAMQRARAAGLYRDNVAE
ncbi:ketopantoate reductase [Comamonas sp. BIGb0124]|uniref:ketopantoate reductase family protein n=1 Tax=Comamonas sp. BIGb0124 TaxID=2485130 RepID=UPI000F488977|nr:2-dehydropantoate 2-reductase [Comamonas sp. BIGb0124]ROR17930.1 ketopantoate reductase [Comamonas sp. BIGb0124]